MLHLPHQHAGARASDKLLLGLSSSTLLRLLTTCQLSATKEPHTHSPLLKDNHKCYTFSLQHDSDPNVTLVLIYSLIAQASLAPAIIFRDCHAWAIEHDLQQLSQACSSGGDRWCDALYSESSVKVRNSPTKFRQQCSCVPSVAHGPLCYLEFRH